MTERDAPTEIDYTNYRGERHRYRIVPTGRLLRGPNAWHPDAPWLIEADVYVKDDIPFDKPNLGRTFDPAHIHRWGTEAARATIRRPEPSADVVKLVDELTEACNSEPHSHFLGEIRDLRAAVLDAFAAKDAEIERLKKEGHERTKEYHERAIIAREQINRLTAELARLKAARVPEELRKLSDTACEGTWTAYPFSHDRDPEGPDWFIEGGGGNLGGDFDEEDARLAAAAVNFVRSLLASEAAPAQVDLDKAWGLIRQEWETGDHANALDACRKVLADGAYHAGAAAFRAGKPDDSNPWPRNTTERICWGNGWLDTAHASEAAPAQASPGGALREAVLPVFRRIERYVHGHSEQSSIWFQASNGFPSALPSYAEFEALRAALNPTGDA